MNKLLLLLLVVPFIGYGQCKKKEKDKREEGTYYGCMNDEGKYHGEGTFTFKSGSEYKGIWKNGELLNGSLSQDLGTQNQEYTGDFINFKPHGQGTFIIDFIDKYKQTSRGEFRSGILFNGITTIKKNDGTLITNITENAQIIDTRDNRVNYYNLDDIICESTESVVNLERRKDRYYINMEFNNVLAEAIFDSGAFGLYVGKRLFDRMKEGKVNYKNLEMDIVIGGVTGEAKSKYVIFDEISIGGCKVKNVIATLNLESDNTLIGVQFFDKFSNVQWDMKEKTLKLYR
jgi:predicted aspartyl protease